MTLAALLGFASTQNETEPQLDVFANNLINLMEMDMFGEIPDYTGKKKDLYERRDRGELGDSDAFKTMDQIAAENGFKTESYNVTTEDGYILGVWRIPGLVDEKEGETKKPPVLLQHGLECDMMQWVFNRESVAPAFVLARAGYDVWMGNNRGNRFSQTHTTLDNTSKEYWTFDWEQMGTKDTPSVIDFILDKTGHDQINYIGHSEGTTQIMAGASLLPQYYKEKMKLCVFLAPPAAMSNNSVGVLEFLAQKPMRLLLLALMDTIKLWNLLPYDYVNQEHVIFLCDLVNGKLCNMVMSVFADADPSIDYTERYDMYMSNLPSGASFRNFYHYAQNIDQKEQVFHRLDYESARGNLEVYGRSTPPDYDMSLIDFPIAILAGEKDLLADPKDVEWTYEQLKHTTVFYYMYYLGHMSFAIAKDMSWFTVDTMALLNHYNDMCDETTMGSNFALGEEACWGKVGNESQFLH